MKSGIQRTLELDPRHAEVRIRALVDAMCELTERVALLAVELG